MIISFSVENWMSFRDRVTLSMVATRERQHGKRLPRLDKYQMRLLPIMALYGGNASGKTNLFKALSFVKTLLVKGTEPDANIPVLPFLLHKDRANQPSAFEFELLIDEIIYAFSFSATRESVVEERLVRIATASERTLYHRRHGTIEFDASLSDGRQFLEFAFQGTRQNQLFLTNSVSQNVQQFRHVYDWFKDALIMGAPDARFGEEALFLDESHPLTVQMNDVLKTLDTGIVRLRSENVPFDNVQLPESLRKFIHDQMDEGEVLGFQDTANSYRLTRKDGEFVSTRSVTVHLMNDGTEIDFGISQESDGSQRLIHLLPTFLDLASRQSTKVYAIDEVDRSLHTLLTQGLLDHYLSSCSSESRTQLLLTTHDILLMNQRRLRRDEMWVTERSLSGASRLFSFSDYRDVRHDKDIRKSYLQGRLGGVPRIKMERSDRCGTKST